MDQQPLPEKIQDLGTLPEGALQEPAREELKENAKVEETRTMETIGQQALPVLVEQREGEVAQNEPEECKPPIEDGKDTHSLLSQLRTEELREPARVPEVLAESPAPSEVPPAHLDASPSRGDALPAVEGRGEEEKRKEIVQEGDGGRDVGTGEPGEPLSFAQELERLRERAVDLTDKEKKILWVQLQKLKMKHHIEEDPSLVEFEKSLYLKRPKAPLSVGGVLRAIAVLCAFILVFPFFIVVSHYRIIQSTMKKRFKIKTNPILLLVSYFSQFLLYLVCVEVHCAGKSNMNRSDSSLLGFFQHLSNLDSFTINAVSPVGLTWIGKESLFKYPFFGQLALSLGTMIGLDRKNREDSIEQLNKTGYLVKNKGISIAISPEGTRSTSGHLNEFKKGPFHLAKASNVPIIPITLYGQFELWPPGQVLPSPGSVSLHFLPAVVDYDQLSYKELLIKIRGIMLEASLDAPIHPPSHFVSTKFWVFHALSMIATYWAFLKFVPLLYNSTSIVYLTAYLMGCYVVSTK